MNINPLYPLTADEAGELAACLLTSSAIETYQTCLENAQATKRLRAGLYSGTVDGKDLLRWSWFHRARTLETPSRSEWELPLALTVFLLSDSGVANVEKLLSALGAAQQPQLAWIAALSRRILANRRGAQLESAPTSLGSAILEEIVVQTAALATSPPSKVRTSAGSQRRLLLEAA